MLDKKQQIRPLDPNQDKKRMNLNEKRVGLLMCWLIWKQTSTFEQHQLSMILINDLSHKRLFPLRRQPAHILHFPYLQIKIHSFTPALG